MSQRENVVDLMDALRKSIGGSAAAAGPAKQPAKKPRKAAAGQKEMLMPITHADHGQKGGKGNGNQEASSQATQVGLKQKCIQPSNRGKVERHFRWVGRVRWPRTGLS